jgi:hypothetical protein
MALSQIPIFKTAPLGLPAQNAPDVADLQRKMALAQTLSQGALTPIQQGPVGSGPYQIQPRTGVASAVSQIGQALMARNLNSQIKTQQQTLSDQYAAQLRQMFGGQSPQQATQAAAPAPQSPQNPPSPQGPYAAGMNQPPASAPPAPPPQAAQPTSSPMNPGALDPNMAAFLYQQDPSKYQEQFVAPWYKPADIVGQLRAAGIDPNSAAGRGFGQDALTKATSNLINVRPSGTVFDANANAPRFTAPSANGMQVNWGPNGPSASVMPGSTAAIAQTQGAETAGKVINTPQTFPTAGGGSRPAYPSDVLGAPPALRGQPGAMPQGSGVQPTAGPTRSPASNPERFKSAPILPISSAIGAPDEFTKGVLQEAGKKHAELASKYGAESDLADQKLEYNQEARKAIGNAELGPSSEWMTENRAKLAEWGIPDSLIPGAGKVTDTMKLNKQLKQSALQGARQIFGSRMTQMEVRLQHEELSPSTSMTKDAIESLMQQDDIKQMYAKQRAQDYGEYVQAGKDPLRFEGWYSKQYPLTKFAAKQMTPPQALQRLQQNPSLSKDFQAKYGWLPGPGE